MNSLPYNNMYIVCFKKGLFFIHHKTVVSVADQVWKYLKVMATNAFHWEQKFCRCNTNDFGEIYCRGFVAKMKQNKIKYHSTSMDQWEYNFPE